MLKSMFSNMATLINGMSLIILVSAAVCFGGVPVVNKKAATPVAASVARRVLLISIDTLRPDYLSCYGNLRVQTPHIDSLSLRGATMDHAVAEVPLTLPSHTSMLSGLYPTRHGVHDNGGTNQPEKAIIEWQKAVQADPGCVTSISDVADPLQVDALLNIGYTLLKLDQPEKARQVLQQFLEKAPPQAYQDDIEKVRQILQHL